MSLAFIGLGRMGEPMAANLVRSGMDLLVWNRSANALARLASLGATPASSAREALRSTRTALMMLANEQVIDEVLERATREFRENVAGRMVVNLGTTSPGYSRELAAAIAAAGGRYVEAPVSGSRGPAERGTLIGMVAGEGDDPETVRTLLEPLCRATFACGTVPSALSMKLAVNLFLITMVTGLVEAKNFAACASLDLELFQSILDAGAMASDVSRAKLDMLVRSDMHPQAKLSDVLMNARLVAEAARAQLIPTPLLDQSHQLFAEAEFQGLGGLDMVAVLGAFEQLTWNVRFEAAHGQVDGASWPS